MWPLFAQKQPGSPTGFRSLTFSARKICGKQIFVRVAKDGENQYATTFGGGCFRWNLERSLRNRVAK